MDSPLRDMNKEKKKLVLTGIDYGYKSYPPTKVDESSYEKGKIAGRDLERMTIMKELAPLLEIERRNNISNYMTSLQNESEWREALRQKWEGANTGRHNSISTPVMKQIISDIENILSNREKEIAEGVENLKERQLKREEVISLVNRKFLNASLPSKDIMKNVYDVFEENHLKTVTVFNKALEKVLSILKH